MREALWLLVAAGLRRCHGFVPLPAPATTSVGRVMAGRMDRQRGAAVSPPWPLRSSPGDGSGTERTFGAYVPQKEDSGAKAATKKPLYPQAGDLVRYYDLDGGRADGQWLVGRITFIQRNLGREGSGWTLELTELEDLGDGFFGDYPARQRAVKRTTRDLLSVSPLTASFVRSENAFRVPRDPATGVPRPKVERYDVDGYEGPFAGLAAVDPEVLEQDAALYAALKTKLLRYAALAGLAGTLVADLLKGPEDAIIYGAGAVASLLYLFLLSVKTDTIASEKAGLGKNIASLRFVTPVLVLAGVAWYNSNLGDASPVRGTGLLDVVTPEQFAAATLGFLTYRLPLFLTQIGDAFRDANGDVLLPGSAGLALQLAKQQAEAAAGSDAPAPALAADGGAPLATVLLVSGPQATGRHELVRRLLEEGEGKYVAPRPVDRVADPATFERLEQRKEILALDPSGRFATTKDGILQTARTAASGTVVVIDADIPLVKKLVKVSGLRLVCVWVGLRDLDSFKARIDLGEIPEGETEESLMRARIREIVQEIEYGLSSGIFEFTVLNDDANDSLRQLREAAAYCLL